MKKSKLFISLLLTSLSLIACDETANQDDPVVKPGPDIVNPPIVDPPEEEVKVEKTKLNYTYLDYMNNYYKTSSAIPNQGEPEILVIPVYFNDSDNFIPEDKKELVKNDIEKCFFGTKEDCGFESVTSYYSTLSCGKCNLKGKVTNWANIDHSYTDYSNSEDSTTALVKSVTDNYFASSNEDRTKYDIDKNGFLDGIVLIYAAPDADNFTTRYGNLWAYTNWDFNAKASIESPTVCNFFWASYDFMYSKIKANEKLGNYYGGGDGSNANLLLDTHVYIHEMGHMFGLVDYYDYSYQYSPAGGFSMQDYNVASHDPFSAMALGWVEPYIPTKSCTITINTFQSSRDVILLANTWNDINSPFDEYILVEFYSPDGLNQFDHENQYFANNKNKRRPTGPDECGIRVWHVDARLIANPYARDLSKITTNPNVEGKISHMMSNTYLDSSSSGNGRGYISILGSDYANYNVLQLIRNEETETYKTKNAFDKYSLFKDGSSFSMNSFAKQFVNKGRLNTNKPLGWNFKVSIENNQATITLIRTI